MYKKIVHLDDRQFLSCSPTYWLILLKKELKLIPWSNFIECRHDDCCVLNQRFLLDFIYIFQFQIRIFLNRQKIYLIFYLNFRMVILLLTFF